MEHNEGISENMEITNNTENTGDIAILLMQVQKPEQCKNDSELCTKTKTNSVSLVMEHNEGISENMEITNNTENTGDIVTLLKQAGKPEQCENDSKSHTKTKTNSVSLVMEVNQKTESLSSENPLITNKNTDGEQSQKESKSTNQSEVLHTLVKEKLKESPKQMATKTKK